MKTETEKAEFWYFDFHDEAGACAAGSSCKTEGYNCPKTWWTKKFLDFLNNQDSHDKLRNSVWNLNGKILTETPNDGRAKGIWVLTDQIDSEGRRLGIWPD